MNFISSRNNNDIENNSNNGGEQPSRSVTEEYTVQNSEDLISTEVNPHGWSLLPKRTYDSIKENKPESDWSEIDDDTIKQERPRGNTLLHIAALYGNDNCVEKVLQIGPHLLLTINTSGDTPLHVAARAGKISTLRKLVAALLHLDPNYEQAKEAILVTNRQGNTFFHEALLNGHKAVMKILDSSPGFKQLVQEMVLTSRNLSGKSVLQLAMEKEIADDLLTRVIPRYTVCEEFAARVDIRMANESTSTFLQSQRALAPPPIEAFLKQNKVCEEFAARVDIRMANESTSTFLQSQRALAPPPIEAFLKQNKDEGSLNSYGPLSFHIAVERLSRCEGLTLTTCDVVSDALGLAE
ncbi:uncharacterized protein LOC124825434, partial [Vigna umbellata]|uniref:uncharacterized protein LOC124825434 n=1 Tax=Vigna umbellata TaxID=87088 RepID=UPI001F5F0BE4